MLEKVLEYERNLFLALNGSSYTFVDQFMWLYSGKFVWIPLILFVLFILIYKKDWREWLLILLAIALVVLLCDQFTSHICKPFFSRFRPTHHPDFMNEVQTVLGYRGGLYGFISGHAANSFGIAIYMALLFRNKLFSWTIFLWAILMAYTRIYLGVHFITDIIPGILSGLLFGSLVYVIYVKIRPKFVGKERAEELPSSAIYSDTQKKLISCALILTVFLTFILNAPLVSLLK